MSDTPAMSSGVSCRPTTLPAANAMGNIADSAAMTRRPPPGRSSVSPMRRMAQPDEVPDLVERDRFDVVAARDAGSATDQGKFALKKMSDSRMSPFRVSIRKFVDASTRSRSGRFRNPSVLRSSCCSGRARVNPAKRKVTVAVSTFSQVRKARSSTCGTAQPRARAALVVDEVLDRGVRHWSVTVRSPTRVPSFRYASAGADVPHENGTDDAA
jgi:hypothetical protein